MMNLCCQSFDVLLVVKISTLYETFQVLLIRIYSGSQDIQSLYLSIESLINLVFQF